MILLLTDFGREGPYVGEMHAVLQRLAPAHAAVDLMHDLPRFSPRPSAYLIARLVRRHPAGSVFVCVVDPDVGMPQRRPVWLEADGRLLVGPDNGLLQVVACEAERARWHEILWQPQGMSASFHGRDLFAPVAARLANASPPQHRRLARRSRHSSRWPRDLAEIVYVDGFGNLVTGIRACALHGRDRLRAAGRVCRRRRTFGEARSGEPFWYENSMGLAELAIRGTSAAQALGLGVGAEVEVCR